VAREDDAVFGIGAEGGKDVGLAPPGIVGHPHPRAELFEPLADRVDQADIRIGRDRREGHELTQYVDGPRQQVVPHD